MDKNTSHFRLYTEKRGNNKYVYIKQTYRVKIDNNAKGKTRNTGKSKVITKSEYVGTEQDVIKRLRHGNCLSSCITFRRLGLVAAAWKIAEEYALVDMINEAFGVKERAGAMTLGEYIVTQSVLQIGCKTSRNKISKKYKDSALKWLIPGIEQKLNAKNYWNIIKSWMGRKPKKDEVPGRHHKKCLDENKVVFSRENISKFDIMLWNKVWSKENIKNRDVILYYDTTKFRVYHERKNNNEKITAGYGSKQPLFLPKLGFALAISEGIPLHYMLYKANTTDVSLFPEVVKEICSTLKHMREEIKDVILVYDKGNNSASNVAEVALADEIQTWIMSATIKNHVELRDMPLEKYRLLNNTERGKAGHATHVYESYLNIYGCAQKVVVLFNPKTYEKKHKRFEEKLEKARSILTTKWARISKQNEYSLKEKKAMMEIHFKETKVESSSAERFFSFHISKDGTKITIRKKRVEIENHQKTFGKQLICSNNLSFEALEMTEIYIHRDEIEKANHHLKSIHIVSVTPIWIWNDVQIEAHIFTVFLSYFLSRILYRRILCAGITISYEAALSELEDIKEGINIYNYGQKNKCVQQIVTRMSPTQKALCDALELKDYLKARQPGLEFSMG
jgi:transposase